MESCRIFILAVWHTYVLLLIAKRAYGKGCLAPNPVDPDAALPNCSPSNVWSNTEPEPHDVGYCCKLVDEHDGTGSLELWAQCCSKHNGTQFCWEGFEPCQCQAPKIVDPKKGLPDCSPNDLWNSTVTVSRDNGHCCKWVDKNDGSNEQELWATCCSKNNGNQICLEGFSREACLCRPMPNGIFGDEPDECDETLFGNRPYGTDGFGVCCESNACYVKVECCATIKGVPQCENGYGTHGQDCFNCDYGDNSHYEY